MRREMPRAQATVASAIELTAAIEPPRHLA